MYRFGEKTVSLRLNTVPYDFLYVWEKLCELNVFYNFNNLFTTLKYLLIICPLRHSCPFLQSTVSNNILTKRNYLEVLGFITT
jgi:hypothetical protein